LLRIIRRKAREFGAHAILIEDAGTGRAVLQTLSREDSFSLIPIRPKLDKVTRAEQQSATIEAGRLYLPEEAPWLEEFEREFLLFPSGPHDDQVDSMTQFLGWITQRGRKLPELRVRLLGSRSQIRDLYFERTGISMFRR